MPSNRGRSDPKEVECGLESTHLWVDSVGHLGRLQRHNVCTGNLSGPQSDPYITYQASDFDV